MSNTNNDNICNIINLDVDISNNNINDVKNNSNDDSNKNSSTTNTLNFVYDIERSL